jgi:ribose/xylose/arabinose/galactoside ABC-type transport system permease subunit
VKPHPHADEEWYRRLPLERQVEMARDHAERLQRPAELEVLARRRMRIEALRMGGVFALFGWLCGSFWTLLVSAVVGTALGWVCSRLDLKRLSTALAGMVVYLGLETGLNSSSSLIIWAFPLGACCALIGWGREERGT